MVVVWVSVKAAGCNALIAAEHVTAPTERGMPVDVTCKCDVQFEFDLMLQTASIKCLDSHKCVHSKEQEAHDHKYAQCEKNTADHHLRQTTRTDEHTCRITNQRIMDCVTPGAPHRV